MAAVARFVLAEGGRKKLYRIARAEFSIGRTLECAVRLADPNASVVHCRLARTAEGWLLEDEGSKAGTQVNGRPVERCLLHSGDEIAIGGARIVYEGEEAPASPAPPRAARPAAAAAPARRESRAPPVRPAAASPPHEPKPPPIRPAAAHPPALEHPRPPAKGGLPEGAVFGILLAVLVGVGFVVFQVLQHGERSGASGTAKGRGADAGEMGEEAGAEGYFSAILERFERNQLVPPARPAARTFLKLCDEFLQRFPGHPKTVEVKGKRSAYASIAKEWEPPTLGDAKFEAKTNLRRGRFGAARQAIADYLRRNPSAPDADEAHGEMATIQVKARERFEDRFSLCQDELARAALTDSLDRRRALDRAVAYLEEADRAAAGVDEAHVAKVAAERDRLRREFGVVAREGG